MLTPFSGEKNCHVEIGPKMTVFGKMGVKTLDIGLSFVVFCVKIGARVSAVAFLKNKKEPSHFVPRCSKSRMRKTKTPKPMWIKFCIVVDISDVVTYTYFAVHRFRFFSSP